MCARHTHERTDPIKTNEPTTKKRVGERTNTTPSKHTRRARALTSSNTMRFPLPWSNVPCSFLSKIISDSLSAHRGTKTQTCGRRNKATDVWTEERAKDKRTHRSNS